MTYSPEHPGTRLEVEPAEDGQWTWSYVDETASVRLTANVTQDSVEQAAESARRAFPDVDDLRLPPPRADVASGDRARELLRLIGAVVLMVVLFEILRRRQASAEGH